MTDERGAERVEQRDYILHKLQEAGYADKRPKDRDVYFEGGIDSALSDRYERNSKARKACIEAHGAVCAICGFDFAKTYGSQFAGIIQVHHIVPLHEIAQNHEVDPVRDLIPVCPNCHVALHSRPGGTYMPDELRSIMNAQNAAAASTQDQ